MTLNTTFFFAELSNTNQKNPSTLKSTDLLSVELLSLNWKRCWNWNWKRSPLRCGKRLARVSVMEAAVVKLGRRRRRRLAWSVRMAPGGSISVVDDVDDLDDLWHGSMMLAIILMMIVTAMNVMTTFMITVMTTVIMTAMTNIMMSVMTSLPSHASYVESAPGSSSAHLSPLPLSCSCPQLLFWQNTPPARTASYTRHQ